MKMNQKSGQNEGAYTGPKVSSPLAYDCKNGASPLTDSKTCDIRRGLKPLRPISSLGGKAQGKPSPTVKGSTDRGDQ